MLNTVSQRNPTLVRVDIIWLFIIFNTRLKKIGFGLVLSVAYLNYNNTVSFFFFLWPIYTLLGAIMGNNLKIGISSVLTLYLH